MMPAQEKIALGITQLMLVIFMLGPQPHSFAQEQDLSGIKDIQEDIQIINLLNSLELKNDQIRFIIRSAESVKGIRENFSDKINSNSFNIANYCKAVKKEVEKGKVTLDQQLTRGFSTAKIELMQAIKDMQEKINNVALNVESKLEQFQIIALDNYKPCIIPIASNGRIGQSDSSLGFVKLLERIKAMPEVKYQNNRDYLASHLLDKAKQRIPPGIELDDTQTKSKIIDAFESVRNLDDVDFQINKEGLAEELKLKILPPHREITRTNKIIKFLLSEKIIPILKRKVYN